MSWTLERITYLDELTSSYSELQPFVIKALTQAPEYAEHDVVRDVLSGSSHMWVAREGRKKRGVVTTAINTYPQTKTCLIHLLGGEGIEHWVHLISEIEKWGKDSGCDSVEIHGRPAWKKLLPDYSTDRIILTKGL